MEHFLAAKENTWRNGAPHIASCPTSVNVFEINSIFSYKVSSNWKTSIIFLKNLAVYKKLFTDSKRRSYA
jgi:hypothetical protein